MIEKQVKHIVKKIALNDYILHLWPDPLAGLKEIKRTLRDGGRIAMAITRFSCASRDNFESLLAESGFRDISVNTDEQGICALGRA